MRRYVLAGALLGAAGCGGHDAGPAPHADYVDVPVPRLAAPAAPRPRGGRRLRFRTPDGTRVTGTLYPARAHAPAAVLVHGVGGGPRQFDRLVADLRRAGFAALTYRSRGRPATDAAASAREIGAAVRALGRRRAVDRERVTLVGASVGGSAVARALGTRLPVIGGVALSPVPGGERARPHDLLLITDVREAPTARGLRTGAKLVVAGSVGHGSALLADPDVRARIVAWLRRLAAS